MGSIQETEREQEQVLAHESERQELGKIFRAEA
jgi:hypothetical protein